MPRHWQPTQNKKRRHFLSPVDKDSYSKLLGKPTRCPRGHSEFWGFVTIIRNLYINPLLEVRESKMTLARETRDTRKGKRRKPQQWPLPTGTRK